MELEFDPDKDRANVAKHGISLSRAVELEHSVYVVDHRFMSERRYRVYGTIDGQPYCLAAVIREGTVRAISLRRSHVKEYARHVS